MPLEVDTIRKDIASMMPDESDLRALVVSVKQVVRDIRAFKGGGWSFDLAFGTIELLASQSAGTISISNGDTALVGVGTSFDAPDHTGYKVLLGGVEYEIESQADATNAVLTTAFASGTDLSGDTYTAYQNRFDLESDVGKIYRVWDQTNNVELKAEPLIEFESQHQSPPIPGNVLKYSTTTRSSTDVKRIIFRPYPTAIAKILYLYEQEHTQIDGVSSNVDFPDEMYEVVIQGVYARLLGLLTNHAPSAQMEQQRFVRMLSDAWRRDQDKGDLKIRFLRQDLGDQLTRFQLMRTRVVPGP